MDPIVEVKHKKPGRPVEYPNSERHRRKREKAQLDIATPGNSQNLEYRMNKHKRIRDEVLGTVCAITGETEDLEIHHLCPSDATERSRRVLSPYSTYSEESIAAEMRKCVRITAKEHKKIHRRVHAIMKEIKELSDLTPRAEKALIDYHTQDETERAIRIGQFLQSLEKDTD